LRGRQKRGRITICVGHWVVLIVGMYCWWPWPWLLPPTWKGALLVPKHFWGCTQEGPPLPGRRQHHCSLDWWNLQLQHCFCYPQILWLQRSPIPKVVEGEKEEVLYKWLEKKANVSSSLCPPYTTFSLHPQESAQVSISRGSLLKTSSPRSPTFYQITLHLVGSVYSNWTPDVYDESPTIITIWLTIMPRMSIFIFILKIFTQITSVNPILHSLDSLKNVLSFPVSQTFPYSVLKVYLNFTKSGTLWW